MHGKLKGTLTVLIGLVALLGLAACGSSGSSSSGSSGSSGGTTAPALPLKPGENPVGQSLTGGKRGGTLNVLTSTDFEHLDPGQSYYTIDYPVMYATQRTLFTYPPNATTTPAPDLATEVPTEANGGITDGGRTVTVHIQHGVRFSPPVNREVTSADVAYAIERGANPNVANPYFPGYFGAGSPAPLVGATSSKYAGGPIPGVQTPTKYTIVFHMVRPGAAALVPALTMPLSAPVPQSYAAPMDKHSPTTYGTISEVATGPYMLQSNPKTGQFEGLGYQAGKSATLVRNPNWSASTYSSAYRPPAYLNRINISIGGNATVIGEQVLHGSNSVELDPPAHTTVELAYKSFPSQVTFTTGSGLQFASLDNAHGPFTNVNLRRAVWAALDREAVLKAAGGSLVGEPMTHFIYPGTNGFTQAGGYPGPQVPWNKSLTGNMAVAEKYMKLAGYKTGKYTGTTTLQVVGANNGNFPEVTQIVDSALTSLGFKVRLTEVDQSVMFSKFCGIPKQQIDVCPSVAWVRDFADPLTVLYETFYGPAIVSTNNSNFGQTNDPQVNAAMKAAALVVNPQKRYQAWGNVDKLLVEKAVALPEYFNTQANVESKGVKGINDLWNVGTWDFAFTSLKSP